MLYQFVSTYKFYNCCYKFFIYLVNQLFLVFKSLWFLVYKFRIFSISVFNVVPCNLCSISFAPLSSFALLLFSDGCWTLNLLFSGYLVRCENMGYMILCEAVNWCFMCKVLYSRFFFFEKLLFCLECICMVLVLCKILCGIPCSSVTGFTAPMEWLKISSITEWFISGECDSI